MRFMTLTTAPGGAAEDADGGRLVEQRREERDRRRAQHGQRQEHHHPDEVLELRLPLGRPLVVRLRLRQLALERLDLARVGAERAYRDVAAVARELAVVERAEQGGDHAEDHPQADLARLRGEELERLVVQVQALEEELLGLPVLGVAEGRLDVDRRAGRGCGIEDVRAAGEQATPERDLVLARAALPPAMALGARVGVAVALGLDVALLEQRDDAGGRRALELRPRGRPPARRRRGRCRQRGGDADVAAEVGGDDALARLGEGVEQAGEELLELRPQRVRQVGVGHVEPRGGDVVERDRAAPVGVAERLEVALGGHRHAAARLGVGDQLDLGWARRGDRDRRCVVRVHAASPWSWCRHSHDRSSGVNQIGPMQHRLQANVPRLRADSVRLRTGRDRPDIASRACSLWLSSLSRRSPAPSSAGSIPGARSRRGRHRGIDLAAAPGTPVRAACTGPVAFAGRIGAAGIVTLRCGPWRVTHMPLATIAVRGGAVVAWRGDRHRRRVAGSRRPASRRPPRRHEVRVRRSASVPERGVTKPVPLGRAPRGPRTVGPPRAGPRIAPRAAGRATTGPRTARAASTGIVAVRSVARLGRAGARARRRGPSSARTYSNPVAGRQQRGSVAA